MVAFTILLSQIAMQSTVAHGLKIALKSLTLKMQPPQKMFFLKITIKFSFLNCHIFKIQKKINFQTLWLQDETL